MTPARRTPVDPDTRRRWRWGGCMGLLAPIPLLLYFGFQAYTTFSVYDETGWVNMLVVLAGCGGTPALIAAGVIWIIAWREHGRNRKAWDWPGLYTRIRPVLRWGLAMVLVILGLLCVHQAMYFAWLTATPVGPTRPVMLRFTVSVLLAFASFPAAGLAVYAFRPRGFPPHRCQKCGYDLTGAPSPKCPECGESN